METWMEKLFDLTIVYCAVACALCLLWYYSTSTYDFWKKSNVKFKKPVPFFGNIFQFVLLQKPMHLVLHELYLFFDDEPYGGIFQLRDPTLLIRDPELITHILIQDFEYFNNRDLRIFTNTDKDLNPLNSNLAIAEGKRWRALRQKITPLFTSGKLKFMYEQMDECVRILDRCIQTRVDGDNVELNVKELSQGFAIDVIGTCAFGISCTANSSKYSKFREMSMETLKWKLRGVVRVIIGAINKKILNIIKFSDPEKEVEEFYLSVVLNTITYRRREGVVCNDALQLMMNLQNTHRDEKYAVSGERETILKNDEFDEIDIVANVFLLFLAGFETTATTLGFCLYEVTLNKDVQNKLRQEVERVQQKYQNQTVESLKELKYMDMVIKETLRKYPAIPIVNRICTSDYVIPKTKTVLPAGTGVIIPTWSIHHDPRYYPHPEVFDPDRFSPENNQNRLNGTYMPFGDGPRMCLGKRFAEMEIKAALARIILKYDLSPSPKTETAISLLPSFFLQPKEAIFIRFSKRN